MSDGDSKYKLFRNYMVNELGISRDDIERWTKEAVAAETNKLIGQINIEDIIRRTTLDRISNYNLMTSSIKEAVVKYMESKLDISVGFKK